MLDYLVIGPRLALDATLTAVLEATQAGHHRLCRIAHTTSTVTHGLQDIGCATYLTQHALLKRALDYVLFEIVCSALPLPD